MARHGAHNFKRHGRRTVAASARRLSRRSRAKRSYTLTYPSLIPLPSAARPARQKRRVLHGVFGRVGAFFAAVCAKTGAFFAMAREKIGAALAVVGGLYEDPMSFLRKSGYHICRGLCGVGRFFVRISRFVLLPLSVMMIVAAAAFFSVYTFGVKVTLGGETVSYMRNMADYEQAEQAAESTVSARIDDAYKMDIQPVYSVSLVPRDKLTPPEQVEEYLAEVSIDRLGKTYALYVDGQLVGTNPREGAISEMLENIKRPYITGEKNESVDFLNDVEIEYGIYSEEFEMPIKQMRTRLLSGDGAVEYSVKKDDDLGTIAQSLDVDDKLIMNLNPDLDAEDLHSGERILVPDGEPLLSVVIRRTITYEEEVPFAVKSSQSPDLWKGMEQVITEGRSGLRRVTADVLLIDGVETGREIVQTQTLSEPVDEVRLVGAREISAGPDGSYSTGSMIWPVQGGGIVTSHFGADRITHAHAALDIAAAYRTPLLATDSGRVIRAGWNEGGYGYNVWIDHGNGFTSRYSHCDEVIVEEGQLVGQGQPIAYMGMTGNATGVHVHFEIKYEGEVVDPELFISPP